MEDVSDEKRDEIHEFALDFLMALYEQETIYTKMLYDGLGLTEDVMAYVHLQANKAMQNLGFDPVFPDAMCQANPAILEALKDDSDVIHDFFSVNGSSYFMARTEDAEDSDYAYDKFEDPRVILYE